MARARRAGEARGGAGTARAMDDILGDILGDDDDGILGGDEEVDEEEEERDEGEVTDAHAVKVDDPELLALSEEAAADQAARDAALATEMIADVHASEALTAGMIADVNNFTVQWTARFEPHILKQTAVGPYSTHLPLLGNPRRDQLVPVLHGCLGRIGEQTSRSMRHATCLPAPKAGS